MLLVPYSSTIETMLCRIPVRIDATTTAVMMPTTMPRIVSADLNLCPAMLSSAIFKTSTGNDVESFIRLIARFGELLWPGRQTPLELRLCKCNDRVEPSGLPRRIKSGNDADNARNSDREKNVEQSRSSS